MKRFIRTKDGRIIDTKTFDNPMNENVNLDAYELLGFNINDKLVRVWKKDIIDQADTIEELIEVGDLVIYHTSQFSCDITLLIKNNSELEDIKKQIKNNSTMSKCELYTKQGRNYVLVWTKEEGVI